MKKEKLILYLIAIAVVVFIIAMFVIYPKLPETLATHFDEKGNPNGFMSKFGFYALSIATLVLLPLILIFVVGIDPLRKNIEKFIGIYYEFVLLFVVFLGIVYLHTIFYNLGYKLPINVTVGILMGVLFYGIGEVLKRSKRNWFIGIRTPWTLSSDSVWEKTHKQGSILFKICGVLALISVFFKDYFIYFVLIPLVLATLYLTVYSYFEYSGEHKNEL